MDIETSLCVLKCTNGKNYILSNSIESIHMAMNFMRKVIYGKEMFFVKYKRKGVEKEIKTVSSLGKHMKQLHKYSQVYSSCYKYSPLIEFFFEEYRKHDIKNYVNELDSSNIFCIKLFDDFITKMRNHAVTIKLKKRVADWESKQKKNKQRLQLFEKDIFKRYARLMVVRLDFNYHKAIFSPEEIEQLLNDSERKEGEFKKYLDGCDISVSNVIEGRVALEEVQKDRKRLFTNMKGKQSLFKNLVGYIWHIEFGREAGYHLHVMFLFDGSKVHKHEYMAQEIGNYWKDNITQGKGYFENCNRKKLKYHDTWALGIVDHWDEEKRKKLIYTMQYFCKLQQVVQVIPYAGCRLFGCGFVHRVRKVSNGRPRVKHLTDVNIR